jgi:hypothetical protein
MEKTLTKFRRLSRAWWQSGGTDQRLTHIEKAVSDDKSDLTGRLTKAAVTQM